MKLRRFRKAGKGRIPSGLAVDKTHKSVGEVAAGAALGLTAGGAAIYIYDRLTSDDDEPESIDTQIDRDIADEERVEEIEREIKDEEKAMGRKKAAVSRAKARKSPAPKKTAKK
jgi:hypothetical protein